MHVNGWWRRCLWASMTAVGSLDIAAIGEPGLAQSLQAYEINVVVPLTGGAAFLGKAEQEAIQQLERSSAKQGTNVGGRPIKFVFHDDQSSPQTAVQLATEISRASPKPAIVLGSAVVAMCNAMAPLMRNGPVLYCLSPGIYPAAGSYVFSSSVATRDLASSLFTFLAGKGWTKIALLTSTDASGQDALKQIKELLAKPEHKQVQLVGEQNFNPTDVSASAQIQRLKGSNPNALIGWSTGAPIGTVFKAILDAGWDIPVATTDGNMTYEQMSQYAPFLPKQLYIPSPPWPKADTSHFSPGVEKAKEAFFNAFENAPTRPDGPSSFAWDPAVLAVLALSSLGPTATAAQVRDFLGKLRGFDGINGTYDFVKLPQRGLDESNVIITLWNPAKASWDIVSEPRGKPL
jgi:branched-chain amino acid transport system substrate-binding protein